MAVSAAQLLSYHHLTATATNTPTETTTPTVTVTPTAEGPFVYTVVEGDNLFDIAQHLPEPDRVHSARVPDAPELQVLGPGVKERGLGDQEVRQLQRHW